MSAQKTTNRERHNQRELYKNRPLHDYRSVDKGLIRQNSAFKYKTPFRDPF